MPSTVGVTELCLRDGHQSLLATRMALEDMAPICEAIDLAGYWSVECWGGATYDACIRFLAIATTKTRSSIALLTRRQKMAWMFFVSSTR